MKLFRLPLFLKGGWGGFTAGMLYTNIAMATETSPFKQPVSPQGGWLSYGIAIVCLLLIMGFIAKKQKKQSSTKSQCNLIEKKQLNHKTMVYVIEYQQQRFLLAENQHALAIHPLAHKADNEL